MCQRNDNGRALFAACGAPTPRVQALGVGVEAGCARAARRAQLLYPDVSRAGELVVLYHDHGKHISADKATPFSLTVRWAKAINY